LESEDLSEENIVFRASFRPLIELIEDADMASEVVEGFHLGMRTKIYNADTCAHGIETTFPVVIGRVVLGSFPDGH
jgi:hypothetical protein